MIVNFIMSYCFILRWQCDVSMEIFRGQGVSLLPPFIALFSCFELDAPQGVCFAHVGRDFASASQPDLC
jgi:hypothetical protein